MSYTSTTLEKMQMSEAATPKTAKLGIDTAHPLSTVKDVMTTEVYAVGRETSVETAKRLLTSHHITGAPVVDPDGKPVGVVTLSDLADPDRPKSEQTGYPLYYYVSGGHPRQVGGDFRLASGLVSDVMSPFVLSITASASLEKAARLMVNEGVHRLLVLADTKLAGIVSSIDLLRGFASIPTPPKPR